MKTVQYIVLYLALACVVFYLFMVFGHYVGKQNLESQYPLVAPLTGEPASWSNREKEVMALILPKCKKENESGDQVRMRTCWIGRAAAIPDGGSSSKILSNLLDRRLSKKK